MLTFTGDLEGKALDWAVTAALGAVDLLDKKLLKKGILSLKGDGAIGAHCNQNGLWHPSVYWHCGGPIIERGRITVSYLGWDDSRWQATPDAHPAYGYWGDTPLIAAMRCYVASKLGEEVDIPEELLK